ncbi:MAG TPA: hypothetical protein VGH93_03830 [Solirubrobacteraceae bacterium]
MLGNSRRPSRLPDNGFPTKLVWRAANGDVIKTITWSKLELRGNSIRPSTAVPCQLPHPAADPHHFLSVAVGALSPGRPLPAETRSLAGPLARLGERKAAPRRDAWTPPHRQIEGWPTGAVTLPLRTRSKPGAGVDPEAPGRLDPVEVTSGVGGVRSSILLRAGGLLLCVATSIFIVGGQAR